MSNVRLQDSSQRQRHRVLHRRQPDGRGRVGVHLDEVPLVQRRLGEEDPAGGSDLLRQHLPPQQVHTRHRLKIKAAVNGQFGSKQLVKLMVSMEVLYGLQNSQVLWTVWAAAWLRPVSCCRNNRTVK